MHENVFAEDKDMDYKEVELVDEFKYDPCNVQISIPKIEPLCSIATGSNEDPPDVDKMEAPIPFITPYKVKDPVILLERCDKIWETLKVIKNVQDKNVDTVNAVSSEVTTKKPYIEYQPILGNNNIGLPNFKFSVKTKKKLFHCTTCGKQYSENRSLRHHSEDIHGIYIPPKRKGYNMLYKKNINKVKEKDPNTVRKEVDNSEVGPTKKIENKLQTETLLPSVSSFDNMIPLDFYSQRRKRNNTIQNNNDVDSNENMNSEQNKDVFVKELKQNEIRNHASSLLCTLCKQPVKDVKKHLIDYHKIESLDFMLKNLNETSTVSGSHKLKTVDFHDKALKESKTTQGEHSSHFQNKKKRRINMTYENPRKSCKISSNDKIQIGSPKNTHQCNICLGVYKTSSFYKHLRIHRIRGETRENLHLSSCKYLNSPLYVKPKVNLNSNDMFSGYTDRYNNGDKNHPNFSKNQIMQNDVNGKCNTTFSCTCGRLFRNPYTMFIHKKKCTLVNEMVQATTESSLNRTKRYITRSSSDRNSRIGINITIKKKNNSYEIIDKDDENENKLQDSSRAKNADASSDISKNYTEIESQNYPSESPEFSKYSRRHSILKIQSVDEDIDIDIEDDSQTNFCDDNVSDSMSKMINKFCTENIQPKIKIEQDELCQENLNLDFLQKKVHVKTKGKQSAINVTKNYNICICSRKFYTKKALEVHIKKHNSSSKLMCGYCKINFSNMNEWNEHQCFINEGKRFIDLPIDINCQYCSAILNTYKKFDGHMRMKHFNGVLPYHCLHCDKRFSNTTSRQIHIATDHGMPVCPICNYKGYDALKSSHRGYHYGLGFPCHACKKTYISKENLTRHWARVSHTPNYNSYESSVIYPMIYNL